MSVQIGTIHLDLVSGPSSSTPTPWAPLSLLHLRDLEVTHESRSILDALKDVMKDPGLGFEGTFRIDGMGMTIRASILPSDSKESTWKRTAYKAKHRDAYLNTLFWHLREGWDGQGEYVMARKAEDLKKMPDLYAAVPSPEIPWFDRTAGQSRPEVEVQRYLEALEEPEGIKTRLYQYQFRSVSKMLKMETQPGRLVDPHFTPLPESGREGVYYVNTWNGDVQRHPGWYDLPRGGILCEQMGTGKTLVCLALIVATLSTPPSVPTDTLDISPAMTSDSLERFAGADYSKARSVAGIPHPRHLPSLVDLCAGVLSQRDTSARSFPYLPPTIATTLSDPLYYNVYPVDDPCIRQAKRKANGNRARKMYLANTTLVVVPEILVEQWKFEVEKHVEHGVLRILEIGKEEVPSVEIMMGYDIVLVDVARFGQEETMYRFKRDLDPSGFTKARWKRIILGHIAGVTRTDAMRLATSLSIERRWIVSGTPTKHLQQGGETEVASMTHTSSINDTTTLDWNKRDLEDASRLGVMIGGFLAAEPFRSESTFQERVTNLLRGKDGPKFGAVRRLKYIMGATMVKHARLVIDEEASLPPMTISHEVLQFHPMQRITYNVIASLIASNVYTSAFEDPDYFLHPKNVGSFKQVVNNLHLACFWYSASEIGAEDCLARTRDQLEKNEKLTPAGRAVLEEACQHLETALATPGWTEWMLNGVSVPYDAEALPLEIRNAWSDSMNTLPEMVDAHSLYKLRELNTPGRSMHDLHLRGWEDRADKHLGRKEELVKISQKEERDWLRATNEGDARPKTRLLGSTATTQPAMGKPFASRKAKKTKVDQVQRNLDEAARNAAIASARYVGTPERDLGPRPMPMTLVTKSRSAKINFVLQSVLDSSSDDKFVIFGDVFELGHVSEVLDLVDVTSVYVGTKLSRTQRAQHLQSFEDAKIKVLLLDVKFGARGLNLVVANRMIFLAPIWNLDVQAQAIKRVHRIGQTKPTKVEILVTQGTFEEGIAERSSSNRTEKEEQTYSRAMIENPSFVYPEDEGSFTFPIKFIPPDELPLPVSPASTSPEETLVTPSTPISLSRYTSKPVSPSIRRSSTEMTLVEPSESLPSLKRSAMGTDNVPPKKKRAKVAFAE